MATLSFQCPKCGKIHDRIKPEMAGFKVRCQCGFIFRLGPKSAKNKQAFKEKIQAKSNSKRKSANATTQSNKDKLLKAEPVDLFGDEMLDLIPDGPMPEVIVEATPIDSGIPPQSDPVRQSTPEPDEESEDPFVALLPPALPVASPAKSRWRKSSVATIPTARAVTNRSTWSSRSGNSLAGPIWTIILSSIGSLIMLANIRLVFIEALMPQFAALKVANSLTVVLGTALTTITLIFAIALTIFLIISGIVAIIELTSRTHRGWAIRWAGFVSFGMLGCLLLMFFNVSANILYAWHLLFCGLVPAATAITGITRNLNPKK
jgi:hypothetical protein